MPYLCRKSHKKWFTIFKAACVNPTNVRRNDSSCNSSCTSSFRSTSRPQGLGQKKQLSCAEKMALESSPIPSPSMSPKKSQQNSRKVSAPPALNCGAAEPDSEAGEVVKTKVPCEFCNEPCSLEALMRHQVILLRNVRKVTSISAWCAPISIISPLFF